MNSKSRLVTRQSTVTPCRVFARRMPTVKRGAMLTHTDSDAEQRQRDVIAAQLFGR